MRVRRCAKLIPGRSGHAREQPENEQIRGLESGDGNVGQVLIAIDHMAADHGAKLLHGDAQLFRGLRFRVLRLPRSIELHLEHRGVRPSLAL